MPGLPERTAVPVGYIKDGASLGGKPVRGYACNFCFCREASLAALPDATSTAARARALHGPGKPP